MPRKIRLHELKEVVRKSGRYHVITTFTPDPEKVCNIYAAAKDLYERYKIVTEIVAEWINAPNVYDEPKPFIRVTQWREIAKADKKVPRVVFFINLEDGRVFVSQTKFKTTDPRILNAAAQMLINNLGYETSIKRRK